MREETESPGLDGFYNTAAVEEMVKKIIVAYLEKNEQADSCLLERKWGDLTYPLWLMLMMMSDWSWDKILIQL